MDENERLLDIDGYEVITSAIMDLVNLYPGLEEDDRFRFMSLKETQGKAIFPVSGPVIERDEYDIVGGHEQYCQYPFRAIYRSSGPSEESKQRIKEFMDNLGRWLEKQPVVINGQTYTLSEYPPLSGSRQFLKITRTTPAIPGNRNDNNGAEDCIISISAHYKHTLM